MRILLIGLTLAVTMAGPVRAQVPSPAAVPPPWPQAAYAGSTYQAYPFPAPTPRDAYREGLINRWEFERFEAPTSQAMQGPSPDGTRGGDGGGGGRE
jgi:hypothetical protein